MTLKRRFRAVDWIELGLSQLSAKGTDAIKLEAICEAAGLTRGSFYYHFSDYESFLIEMVESWGKIQTDDVAEKLGANMSAEDKAIALTGATLQIDYRLELGIRELSRRVPEVAKIVQRTDAKRLAILATIYADRFKLESTEARNFAYLEYAAFCGMFLLDPDLPMARQHELAACYDEMVKVALSRTLSGQFQSRP